MRRRERNAKILPLQAGTLTNLSYGLVSNRSLKLVLPEMYMATDRLSGHTALVTGGSRGIGAAIVRALALAGVAVAVNYRERTDEANALVKSIIGAGGKATAVAADVSQADAVAKLV